MRAEAIGQEGEKLYQAGDYQQAVDKFQEALQLAPSNPNLLLDMGNTLADLGWKIGDRYKLQESVIYLTKALELFPDFDRARANLNVSRTKLADLR